MDFILLSLWYVPLVWLHLVVVHLYTQSAADHIHFAALFV